MIEVRDSKDRGGPILRFAADTFAAFVDGIKQREADYPTR